jgi:hypothetical protein
LAIESSEAPAGSLQIVPLPVDFVVKAWHQLLISYSGSVLTVQLDGLQTLEAIVEQPARTFALLTEQCSAAFSGISLTDHFRDEFLNDQHTPFLLGWRGEASDEGSAPSLSDWCVQDGTLKQTSVVYDEHILLKGSPLTEYECGATMMLDKANEHEQPAFGLVVWHSSEEKLFVLLSQRQSHWMLLVQSHCSAPETPIVFELSRAFDPFRWHTLRLRCCNEQLTVYLDGPQVLAFSLPARPEKMGLITRSAAGAFKSVWQTGLGAFR